MYDTNKRYPTDGERPPSAAELCDAAAPDFLEVSCLQLSSVSIEKHLAKTTLKSILLC
jgi:hypothetical protein